MFERDDSQPLGLWTGPADPPPRFPELRCLELEFSSRGDRVPGRLWLPPAGDGPFPVVLLQHGLGGSRDADYLVSTGGPWAQRGAAVFSIDFPLHGSRSEGKLGERLVAAVRQRDHQGPHGELIRELFRQAVADLGRCVDVAEEHAQLDAKRLVYAGFSMGSVIGAVFCGVDPRPRAAALAIGGAGLGPPDVDAVDYIGRIAPRPLLMVNTTRDEIFPRERVMRMFDAAAEPKELLWFEGAHADVPGQALKKMWEFLRPHLDL